MTNIDNFLLNSDLQFILPNREPILLPVKQIKIDCLNSEIRTITAILNVDFEQYQLIEQQELFNLKKQVKGNLLGNFLPEKALELEISLRPDFFLVFELNNLSCQSIYQQLLLAFAQDKLEVKLTENWYCLQVKQQQDSKAIGYFTVWNRLDLGEVINGKLTEKEVVNCLLEFIKDEVTNNDNALSEEELKIRELMFSSLGESFEELSKIKGIENIEKLEDSDKFAEIIGSLFEKMLTSVIDIASEEDKKESQPDKQQVKYKKIFEVITDFFKREKWDYIEVEINKVIRVTFQGENGQWNCYAQVMEEYNRFLFYSICPVTIPATKRNFCAEFITRANSNLGLGNFEMDFDTGEVKYKTSIEAKSSLLTDELLQKLVYVNVLTLDRYLPGLMSLIYANISPKDAIWQVESQ